MSDITKVHNENLPQKQANKIPDMQKVIKKYGLTISIMALIVLFTACVLIFKSAIGIGAEAVKDGYAVAYEENKNDAYQKFYRSAYDRAEAKYHVSNEVLISIENFEETEKLEVLEVNHVELITENGNYDNDKVVSWIKVPGKGTFVVDLNAAEFIVDNEHRYVCVRVPYPELTNITTGKPTRLLFKDDFWNGNYSDGVHLAVDQINDAEVRIKKALMANQYIYKNAQDVAISMISNLVKELNPDVPDISVEVEFMD